MREKKMTNRKEKYLRYLGSWHWEQLRKSAFERDGWKCVRCGSDRLIQGHNKRYRRNFYRGKLKDIETLCGECHKKHHEEEKQRWVKRKLKRSSRRSIRLVSLIMYFDATDRKTQ